MYAYLDQEGVLHLTESEDTAKRSTTGKVVETTLKNDGGYPVIGSKTVVYYAYADKTYVDGNKADGTLINTPTVIRDLAFKIRG